MKMTKRILSWLLAMVLLAGLLPLQAFAEPQQNPEVPAEEWTTEEPAAEEVPAEEIPAEEAPAEEVPAEGAPVEEPEEETPLETAPVEIAADASAPRISRDGESAATVLGKRFSAQPQRQPIPEDRIRSAANYLSLEEAGYYLEKQMIARVNNVEVAFEIDYEAGVTDEYAAALWHELFYFALAHSGRPNGGDYLSLHLRTVDGVYDYSSDENYLYFTFSYAFTYATTAAQEAEVDAAVASAVKSIYEEGMRIDEAIEDIYYYVTTRASYDKSGMNAGLEDLNRTAYGAIIQKSALCEGYAALVYRLCLELSIDCRIIAGTATTGKQNDAHVWNIVRVNGYCFNVDAACDDANWPGSYKYYMKGESNFTGHTRLPEYASA